MLKAIKRIPWIAILSSPTTIFIGAAVGGLLGFYAKGVVPFLQPLGLIYQSLLTMCILPIIITAIISGVAKLLQSENPDGFIRRLTLIYGSAIFLPAAVGIICSYFGSSENSLNEETRIKLGKMMTEAESIPASQEINGLFDFIKTLIPENIFFSLSQGENLRIVVFSLILGIALGVIKSDAKDTAIQMTTAFYQSFITIFTWLMYALPFGLCFIMAGEMAKLDSSFLLGLMSYITITIAACLVLSVIYQVILWKAIGGGFFSSLKPLQKPLFLAFVSDDSFIAMPSAIESMEKGLKCSGKLTKMLIPLGIVMNRHSIILCFALTSTFLMQFYGIPVTVEAIAMILISSIIAGMAALGPTITYAPMIIFVLQPLGIPVEPAVLIIVATGPLIGRFLSAINVHANCALLALLAPPDKETKA